jgi:hypothetical protein
MAKFQPFDPERWDEEEEAAKPAKAAKPELTLAALATLAGGLPGTVSAGLRLLDSDQPPKGVDPVAWRESVTDAHRLEADGWAGKALGLGWTALDLFGAVAERSGDPWGDGLAVWLGKRKLLALTADKAIACDPNGTRHYFLLPRPPGARLMWGMGGNGR